MNVDLQRRPVFSGVLVTSAAILMLELALTRLFSDTMYYHFAFLAISLGLLGSAASGVLVYLAQARLRERAAPALVALAGGFSLTTVASLVVVLGNPLQLGGGGDDVARLVLIYLTTALPFFMGGGVVTLAVTCLAHHISRLYLYDMAGAAAGCLLLLPVLGLVGAVNAVILVAVLAALAAWLFSLACDRRAVRTAALGLLVGMAGLLAVNCVWHRLDVRHAKGVANGPLLFSRWNSFSRITVSGDLREGDVVIRIDDDASTCIIKDAGRITDSAAQRDCIEALAYHLEPRANVLIIGPGGGNDVVSARCFGARVTAVEVNPLIARDVMSSEPFRSYSGALYEQPDVKLVVDEGRSFIRHSSERYDVIQACLVDTWAATAAGAFSLTENNLYTVEAFEDYIRHLSDRGILTMTRWHTQPPAQVLRLISLTREAMSRLGMTDPASHVMIVREAAGQGGGPVPTTFLFKRSPFTADEVARVEALARAQNREILFTPATRPDNPFTALLTASDPYTLYASWPVDVSPTFDDNPFFFNSTRLRNLRWTASGAVLDEWQKTNLGTFILFVLLLLSAAGVLLFVVAPLFFARPAEGGGARRRDRLWLMLYFACLGAAYVVVEVSMVAKFILLLGHPVYSLAVVLFSLLAFSGVGSKLAGRFDAGRLTVTTPRVILLLVLVILAYTAVLPPLFYQLVGIAQWQRIVIATVLLAPLATLMGMPMPLGIRIAQETHPQLIPWMWGINGAASVMGSVGAIALALLVGFNAALGCAAAFYLFAVPCISVRGQRR